MVFEASVPSVSKLNISTACHTWMLLVCYTQLSASVLISDFICSLCLHMLLFESFCCFNLVMRLVRKVPAAGTLSFQLESEVGFGVNYIQMLRNLSLHGIGLIQS